MKGLLFAIFVCLTTYPANGQVYAAQKANLLRKIILPASFSVCKLLESDMVIPRDKPFVISGQAPPNLEIKVNVSWKHRTFKTGADSLGNWKVVVPPREADDQPQTITAKANGFDDIVLSNILIGDVWICAGQSNMLMPLDSIYPFKGVLNYRQEIAAADFPSIRVLDMQDHKELSDHLNTSALQSWSICNRSTVGKVSAVAYYFARKLNLSLHVPIGIIIAAVSGSLCQDWTNAEAIKSDPVLSSHYLPGSSALYNEMISSLTDIPIKGVIWYQGESNESDEPYIYTRLNSALINGWRQKFNQDALPFYYVQLTPFADDYSRTNPPGDNSPPNYYAKFREAQTNIRSVPGAEMAVTMDVGEPHNHHPRDKKPVGERLAMIALKNAYHQDVQCLGPQYSSFSVDGSIVTVHYVGGTAEGLNTGNNNPLAQFFFVAGTDHRFRQGTATIRGNTIQVVAPPGTPLPILAVRYAFTNGPVTNLQNSAGLPAEPFRTDKWTN
ncbi:MAG TPA: sialate O-acetylesterase [Mucilaginibacter sp.]|nr:sialate O-acetylesterase [Mucilaginibacter sp.]